MVRFGILGPVELRCEERVLPVGGARQVALLAFLLLHANRAVSRSQLQEALWSELPPDGASKRVQVAMGRLRKSLEPLARPGDGGLLRTVSAGYLLTVQPGDLDADVFKDAVAEGRRLLDAGSAADASRVLCEALALWRGPALAEVAYEDFARAEIGRLEELRLSALDVRIEADLALGRHSALIGELHALSIEHPERESLSGHLMLALYRCGRQSDALDAYQRLSAHLLGELGLHPGPALQSLQRAILDHATWLNVDAGEQAHSRGGAANAAAREPADAAQEREHAFALPSALRIGGRGAFVGRGDALSHLARCYTEVQSGRRQVFLVCGEPGVGKTRLAAEFALQAHGEGAVVLYGRCDEEMLLPHQPFVEALRHYVGHCDAELLPGQLQLIGAELRRLVPELAERFPELGQPLAGDLEGARHRLFEAVCAFLCRAAQTRPIVLVLDDLHWADTATLLLLKCLARYPRAAKLMVIGTYRDTDVGADHPLAGVLAVLDREGLSEHLTLGCLDEGAVAELVEALAANGTSAQLQRAVFEQTEGHAFFVVEALRQLADADAGDDDAVAVTAAGALPMSEGVKSLIGRRLWRLGSQATRVLEAACVVGHAFSIDVLGRVCAVGQDELLDSLDLALRARLVEEVAGQAGRYAFAHALIRDVQYDMLTAARRSLLHRRVAVAIEDICRGDLAPHFAVLAHHFGLAGSAEALDKAVHYANRAGEREIGQLAYEQAAAHYAGALALLAAHGGAELRVERCDLTIGRGEAERMAGDPSYRQTLLDGARIASDIGDAQRLARAALANSRGLQSSVQGVDHERVAVLQAALAALDERDSATRAGLLARLGVELVADDDWRYRSKLADDALAMARRVGDASTLARVLTMRALSRWNPQTLADRNADLLEAWQLAERGGDSLLGAQVAYLGCDAALERGDLEHARRLLTRLDALAVQLRQPIIEWNAAVAHTWYAHVTAPPREAEGLAFAAYELGLRAGQPDADVWLLGGIFAARFLQGTLDLGEPNLPLLFEQPGSAPVVGREFTPSRSIPLLISAGKSVILCEVGRDDDARKHFELLAEEFAGLAFDYARLPILTQASITCAHLGDAQRAEQLHGMLEPYGEQFISTGGSWFGAVRHHLALLLATTGALQAADTEFAAAERAYEQLGAPAWLARCRLDWATALQARARRGDAQRAGELLAKVIAGARELDLTGIETRARGLREQVTAQRSMR